MDINHKKKVLKTDVLDYLSRLLVSYFDNRTKEEVLSFSTKSLEYSNWKTGNLDSTSITAIEASLFGIPIDTYIQTYLEPNVLAYRKAIACQVVVRSYFFDLIDNLTTDNEYYILNATLMDDVQNMYNSLLTV